MRRYFSAIAMLFLLFTFGCAPTVPSFTVNVDTIGDAEEFNTSYVLIPGNKDTTAEDLEFKEYASYVERALSELGFIKAESFDDAATAIFLGYGIGEPQEQQYTYSEPTWGQTGVSSTTTTGSVSSNGSYSETTTYTPTYGITGSTTHYDSNITYLRFMFLDAVDLNEYKKSKKEIQIWKTKVSSSGSSGDLRRIFPILVAASQNNIGKNTGTMITVNLLENDPSVLEIKGIAVNKPK